MTPPRPRGTFAAPLPPVDVSKRALALWVCALSVAACGPADPWVDDLTQDRALLVGSWEWVRSVGYGDGSTGRHVETPASTGRTESVTFRPDGTLVERVDADVRFEGPYEVRLGSVYVRGAVTDVNLGLFGVDEDDLILSTAPSDGPTKYYRRAD